MVLVVPLEVVARTAAAGVEVLAEQAERAVQLQKGDQQSYACSGGENHSCSSRSGGGGRRGDLENVPSWLAVARQRLTYKLLN